MARLMVPALRASSAWPICGNARGDVSLRGDESRHTAFGHEFRDVRPFDLPLHDGQGGDHLIVGLGHVARPAGRVISELCSSGAYLSTSVILSPAFWSGSKVKAEVMA